MRDKTIIGTWPLSGDFGNVRLKAVEEILVHCRENGFLEFDTAPNYGNGFMEFALGKVFYKDKGVIINTKFGNRPFALKSYDINDLKRSLDDSLKRLSRDTINVLFLHNPRQEVADYDSIVSLLNGLKAGGMIKYSGISLAKGYNYPENVLDQFDIIQDDINLLYQKPLEKEYAPNQQLMARSPLATGILSGNLDRDTVFSREDQRSQWLKGERLTSLLKRVEAITKLCPEISLPTIARKFLLQESKIDRIVFGVSRKSHVDDLLEELNKPDLPLALAGELKELYKRDFNLVGEEHLGY